MRNNSPLFWPGTQFDESFNESMNKNYSDSINILQTQWYQADVDQRFALGDQEIWGILFPGLSTPRRKMFNFNLINGALQMISGYQRRNRKSSIVVPVHNEMQKTADQLTKCLYYVNDNSNFYQILSDGFEQGALTQGIGLISVYTDHSNDPISGDIKYRYLDFKQVLIDPFFRKHDLSDCRFIWTRQFFSREEAKKYYPQFAEEIEALPRQTAKDDKFYYMPEVYQIQFPDLMAFDEYWYLSSREATFLVDIETEETQEFAGDEEDLREVLLSDRFKNRLKIVKQPKPTVRRAILINNKVLVDEENPYGLDKYPFVPTLGYFTPDTAYYAYKFRGVVRDMRDAQYLFNRRKVADLDILEAQQMGIKMKKGSLVTPDDALNTGHGRVLTLDPSAQMSDVEKMQIEPPSPVLLQMEEMLKSLTLEIAGANEELMGSATDEKAGILSALRQGAGLTRLQRLFDQLDESQRLLSNITVEIIQKNWTFGKVKQVIAEEPTEEFDSKLFFKYGAKVVLGVLTDSQMQLEAQQLLYAREIGMPISSKRILAKLQIQDKDDIMREIDEQEKAQAEQAQAMSQIQMQQMQVENETKMAEASSKRGLAAERIAKIQLDQALNAERLARSHEDRTSSILNLVKAAKEIEGMDVNQLADEINILSQLQEMSRSQLSPAPQPTAPMQAPGQAPPQSPMQQQPQI